MKHSSAVAVKVGDVFGRWTVTRSERVASRVACRCSCGTEKEVNIYNLIAGKSISCGCSLAENSGARTHGLSKTPEYQIWKAMKARCYSVKHKNYAEYGGRGIKLCAEWVDDAAAFIAHVGNRPSESHSIDRIDCNGDYDPGNCRWVTQQAQMRNTRRSHIIEYDGRKMTIAELADIAVVSETTLYKRVYAGWDIKLAAETPARKMKRSSAHSPL